MRALLLQSPATSAWVPRRQWEPPSIAMATIAGQIDRHDVRVADMTIWRKQAVGRLMRLLAEFQPHVVGFTSMTFQYDTTAALAQMVKERYPSILTALGGYHATLFADQLADGPDGDFWDFIFRGEGDFSFGELLDCLEVSGSGLSGILGLSYKDNGRFIHNGPRPLEDLATIRIPARSKRVARGFHMYFRRADVIETSRGCTYDCNFCSIREMYGRSFRVFPIDRVLADIEDAYSRGARHIFCTDDNITLDMDRFEQLCDGVIGLKLRGLMFTTQASPIGFARSPGVAKKMAQAGFTSIFLGIENHTTQNLRTLRKPNTVDLIRKGVEALQKERIIVIAGIINGLPEDDADSIRENFRFIKGLGITGVMDQLLTPYPKTPLREEMLRDGLVRNMSDFRWYDGYFSNVRTRHLSAEELNFVRWKVRREIIGMWRPTPGDWKFFKGYTYLWEFGMRHLIWLNERMLERLLGLEGRYKLQMRHYLALNDFGLPAQRRDRSYSYHPIFGTADDPYAETRRSVLRRKLGFGDLGSRCSASDASTR
ncbi:MAG: radical SAM protein [Acidobacteriota bacterium]